MYNIPLKRLPVVNSGVLYLFRQKNVKECQSHHSLERHKNLMDLDKSNLGTVHLILFARVRACARARACVSVCVCGGGGG